MKTLFIGLLLSVSSFSFAGDAKTEEAKMGQLAPDKMTHGVICSDEEGKEGDFKKKKKSSKGSAAAVGNG
jgi:hypothetical protein